MSNIHVRPTERDRHIVETLRRHLSGAKGAPATTAEAVRYALRVAYRRLQREERKRGRLEERATA